jgi:hypothetical protein
MFVNVPRQIPRANAGPAITCSGFAFIRVYSRFHFLFQDQRAVTSISSASDRRNDSSPPRTEISIASPSGARRTS